MYHISVILHMTFVSALWSLSEPDLSYSSFWIFWQSHSFPLTGKESACIDYSESIARAGYLDVLHVIFKISGSSCKRDGYLLCIYETTDVVIATSQWATPQDLYKHLKDWGSRNTRKSSWAKSLHKVSYRKTSGCLKSHPKYQICFWTLQPTVGSICFSHLLDDT